jgi:hypothetical protein
MGGANVGSDGFSSGACVRFKREDGGGADKWAQAVSRSGEEERAATVETTRTGPAQQGRKKARARGPARWGRQQADWAERREGEEKKFFSFSYLIFQIHFPKFLKFF